MNIEKLVLDLCAYDDEQEWFEFKENWFQPEVLGEYVSALSNAAAFHYKAQAYFVWGVNDETHEVVGTTFNQYGDYNKEPVSYTHLDVYKRQVLFPEIPVPEEGGMGTE